MQPGDDGGYILAAQAAVKDWYFLPFTTLYYVLLWVQVQTTTDYYIMQTFQTLALIAGFIAAHFLFLFAVMALLKDNNDAAQSETVNALRYNGVLYLASNDKAVDVYRHTDTNAVYYKQGVQYRSAITGRIVSTNAALIGAY